MNVVKKWKGMAAGAERQLAMLWVALKCSDFQGLYDAMDEAFPK